MGTNVEMYNYMNYTQKVRCIIIATLDKDE